jgi:lipopolysaccharide export system permease protein
MRIDWYVFREWFKVFALTLAVLFGLLLISDVQDNLPDLLGFGISKGDALAYYLVKFPSFVPVALPMGFMVSLLFSLGQFHRNHEITAMRAAGFSLFRITRSLWLSAIVLTVLLFQLNARIIPWSVEQSRELWNEYAYSKALEEDTPEEEVGLLYNLTFFNRKDGRLWFLNRFNEFNYRAYGITISEIDGASGMERRRLVANRGFFDDLEGGWTLNEGRETTFDPVSGEPVRSLPFDRLQLGGFSENPSLMKALENP